MQFVGKSQLRILFFMLLFSPLCLIAESEDCSPVMIEDIMVDDSVDSDEMTRAKVTFLSVTDNIFMVDSVDSDHGNIIKPGNTRFIHNHGQDNTFVGLRAGNFRLTGVNNTGIGADALRPLTTGERNTAVGKSALRQCTNGSRNIAVGFRALRLNQSGVGNVAVGDNALANVTVGVANVAIGRNALRNYLETQEAGNNIAVGTSAGISLSNGSNNIYIGNSGVSDESNVIRIGNNIHQSCFIAGIIGQGSGGVPVYASGDGQLGTNPSSSRFKRNINTMNNESERIYNLIPVTFVYKNDESEAQQFGLIAEEVDAVFPQLVVYDADGAAYTVRYEVLPVLLLNEMKKLKQDMQLQKQDNDMLWQAFNNLQDKVQRFMAA